MRNAIQLAIVGFIGLFLLCAIIGSVVGIGIGLSEMKNPFKEESPKTEQEQPPGPGLGFPQQPLGEMPEDLSNSPLVVERARFKTTRTSSDFVSTRQWPEFIQGTNVDTYQSPVGGLQAYLSGKRGATAKRPGVIWVHNGFGGIGAKDWEQARIFDEKFVLMCPSFRRENNNPGDFEMLYGEVDDLLAAVDYLGRIPSVDRNRIYVVGNGSGGTLAMLAAATGTTRVRAFFAIGGEPNLEELMKRTKGAKYEGTSPPFDYRIPGETRLRSAAPFVGSIRRKTFFIESSKDSPQNVLSALKMMAESRQLKMNTFLAFSNGAIDHSAIVRPALNLIARKIAEDVNRTPDTTIQFVSEDISGLSRK